MDIIWGLLHLDQHINVLIAQHGDLTYAILFAIVFCEMGLLPLFFLPGDPLLFFCGALCAAGAMNVWLLLPLLLCAAVLGSLLNYAIGAWLAAKFGKAAFTEPGFSRREFSEPDSVTVPYTSGHKWLDQSSLQKSRAFYEKYGQLTFVLSPFIAVVRTFAPFVAGISGMALRKFIVSMLLGAVLWTSSLIISGYFFGNIPVIRDHISSLVLAGLALGLGSLAISTIVRKLGSNRHN